MFRPVTLFLSLLVGMGEAGSLLLTQLLVELENDNPTLVVLSEGRRTGPAIRTQTVMMSSGVILAYAIGAEVYGTGGVVAACWLGIGLSLASAAGILL